MGEYLGRLQKDVVKLERERDEAREEVAASLDALVDLQTKYDTDCEITSLELGCVFALGALFAGFCFWLLS